MCIVLQLSIKRIGIEITVAAALYAVRDMNVEREHHVRIVCELP